MLAIRQEKERADINILKKNDPLTIIYRRLQKKALMALNTKLLGLELKNPLILSSGILGTTPGMLKLAEKGGAGAVTTKSIGVEKRDGHPNPIITEVDKGFINAVGLSNPGMEKGVEEIQRAKKTLKIPLIASIFAFSLSDFEKVARKISEAGPDLIEVNISCPNVEAEHGKPFATDPKAAGDVAKAVKKNSSVPFAIKLSPNVSDIKEIAKAVEGHADAITAINTVGPGMKIDIDARKAILANKSGGLSGPAIRPVAVKCVNDIRSVTKKPIIGTGGVTTGRDAIEMIMAGADAVGIGTGVFYRGPEVFAKAEKEMSDWLEKEKTTLEEIKGCVK